MWQVATGIEITTKILLSKETCKKQKCRECFWLKRRAALPGRKNGMKYLTVREETSIHQVSVYMVYIVHKANIAM